MISKAILRAIRDQLPMDLTIAKLGNAGPPAKWVEGYFRFLCPACGELRACLLYTSPSPRDQRGSRMPSSA